MRTRLFSLLLFVSTTAFSQLPPYQPLLENGKTWDAFSGDVANIVPYQNGFRYFTDGSALYEGQAYQKVWHRLFLPTAAPVFVPPFELGSAAPFGLIREDTIARKVYFRRIEFDGAVSEERLIYDFSLPVGDSIRMASGVWYVLDSIGMTAIETGELRRKFSFHAADAAFSPTFYIEGIGGKNDFSNPLIEYFESHDDLVCVKKAGAVLYSAGAYTSPCGFVAAAHTPEAVQIALYPNPVGDELNLEIQAGMFDQLTIHDMDGKVLATWPVTAGESRLLVPLQQIPGGTFGGVLMGEKHVAHFKLLKIR